MLNEAINHYKTIVKESGVSQEKLDDLANAICICDMLYGDNCKKLSYDRLVFTTKDLFKPTPSFGDVLSSGHLTELPRVQVLRVLCDIVRLLSKSEDHKPFTVVGAFSPCSLMINGGHERKTFAESHYATEENCIKYLKLMSGRISASQYTVLVETIKSIQNESNRYFGLLNKRSQAYNVRDLYMPVSTRFALRGYTTDTMNFVDDSDFEKHLSKLGCSVKEYVNCIKAYAFVCTIQNIVTDLESLARNNIVMFCTVCRVLLKTLKANGLVSLCCNTSYGFAVVADGPCMNIKLYREYIEVMFSKTGIIANDSMDIQLDLAKELIKVMKRWCKK